ncbi:MAG TPA: hypothetical protein DCE56_39960 [Cyanobacteria bacterium UBA8553]|nr:hypothetical protein [Cyanobacteria bacterium UBA8553]
MKTQTQLIMGILGLSAFISLPVLAQNNLVKDSFSDKPGYTAQSGTSSPNRPVEDRKTPNSPTNAAPGTKNLVDQAASNNQFQTLAKAIKAAGLEKALAEKGPYTLFAPTDKAFAALPPEALEQLLKPENKDILVQLLSYHVVPGSVTSSQIKPGQVETLAGKPVTIKRGNDGTVSVNNAKVTQADIQASNGVIHAVDQVILPPDAQPQPPATQPQSETSPKP